jgi:hypothetical protein
VVKFPPLKVEPVGKCEGGDAASIGICGDWNSGARRSVVEGSRTLGGSMRTLWTLLKVLIGLAIAIPVCMFVLSITLGVVGVMIGLAFLAVRLAIVGAIGYGVFRLARHLFAPKSQPAAPIVPELPAVDPYYQAAMRELDAEIGRAER